MQKLVHEHPKRPNISFVAIATLTDLRCKPRHRTHPLVLVVLTLLHLSRQVKGSQVHFLTLDTDNYRVRLNHPVDVARLVAEFKSCQDLVGSILIKMLRELASR